MRRPGSLLLGAALMAAPSGAGAFTRTATETGQAMRWVNPQISVDLYTSNPPAYLDQETLVQAVEAAAATWSKPRVECTDLEISVRAFDDESAPVAYDGTNRITFRRDEWRKIPCDPETELCGLYDQRAIALTSVFARKSDGRILDSDMELNAVQFLWADVVRDGPNLPTVEGRELHDLQNVMTHEMGHLIGLDHNCYDPDASPRGRPNDHLGNPVPVCRGAPAPIRAATMYNSAAARDVSKRDLTDDDMQAVCAVYPAGSPVDGGETEGCAMGRPAPANTGRPGALLAVLAAGLATVLGARRRRG
jgi:hypothetical protein